MITLIAILAFVTPQDGEREMIDRRDQARGAFMATPESVYSHYCSHCHGDDRKGSGRLWATELTPKPPDLTATALTQEALVKFITEGSAASGRSSLCPPWGRTIPPDEIRRLVAYLRPPGGETVVPRSPVGNESASAPVPWTLLGVIAVEIALLLWMLRKRKESTHAIQENPPVRG